MRSSNGGAHHRNGKATAAKKKQRQNVNIKWRSIERVKRNGKRVSKQRRRGKTSWQRHSARHQRRRRIAIVTIKTA